MIECVARAICQDMYDGHVNFEDDHERFMLSAKAAIEAMRDGLTEEMKVAGLREGNPLGELLDWNGSHDSATREDIESIWKAMHNTALQQDKE